MNKNNQFIEPLLAWQHGIEPLDIRILNELENGASPSTLDKTIKEKYGGGTYARSEIEARIARLKAEKILLGDRAGWRIDPSKLYNYLFWVLIKLLLYRPFAATFKGWKTGLEELRKLIEDKYPQLTIIMMFVPEGESAYDICLFLGVNDRYQYYQFLEEAGEKGLIQSSQSLKVHPPAGF